MAEKSKVYFADFRAPIHGNDADPDAVDDDHIMAEDICLICGSFLPGLYNDIFHLPCGAQRCCDDGDHGLG